MTGLADNYAFSGTGGAVVNHGLYTDTVWAVPVTFRDTTGAVINLTGHQYVAEIVSNGVVVFAFRSSGAASNEGTLDLTNAATGVIGFNATIPQHSAVKAGLYRVHLKRDLVQDAWLSEGSILIGDPGAIQTFLTFDDPGAESAGAMTYAQQAAASAASAVGSAGQAAVSATAAASSASTANTSNTAAQAAATAAAASQTAAAGSASSAASDSSTATTAAATATTKAGEAAASATSAANSATAASGSAASVAGAATTATTKADEASASAAAAAVSQAAAASSAASAGVSASASTDGAATSTAKASEAAASAAAIAAVYGSADSLQSAVRNAQVQASLAQGFAASASSVVQQDLSGVTAQALHRSPNAITSMFIYDTSKDSDGGAWTKKCQHTSWYNESLYGKWLGAVGSEHDARTVGATLGPELVANGSFATDLTGWTAKTPETVLSLVGGRLRVASTGAAAYGRAETAIATVIGKTYVMRVDAFAVGSSGPFAYIGSASGSNNIASYAPVSRPYISFTAISTTTYITLYSSGSTGVFSSEYDNVSVKEVAALNSASGDYFQLSTDGKFYRLWKNLFRASEQFDDANWVKTNVTVTANAGTAPDGTNTAYLVTENTATGSHAIYQVISGWTAAGRVFTAHFDLKAAGRRYVSFGDSSNAAWNVGIDLQTGTIVSTGGITGSNTSATITPLGNDWHRVSLTFTEVAAPPATNNTRVIAVMGRIASGSGSSSYAGDGASGFYIKRGQLEAGATVTDYEFKLTTDSYITEVFSGNKREFPKLAAIVSEGSNVTIYDLTEPGRPMWMRFVYSSAANALGYNNITCVTATNGQVVVGSGTFDLYFFNYATDAVYRASTSGLSGVFRGVIADRHVANNWNLTNPFNGNLPNRIIYAVAATVLPDAPIDPATGLRVPTFAVATHTGVSVIKHNGTIVSSSLTSNFGTVAITPYMLSAGLTAGSATWYYAALPGTLSSSFTFQTRGSTQPPGFNIGFVSKLLTQDRQRLLKAGGTYNLIQMARVNEGDVTRSLISTISGVYNTGWMAGDIRRCLLSDTISGGVATSELVVNGGFDTDTAWTKTATSPATVAISGGVLTLVSPAAELAFASQNILSVGRAYRITGSVVIRSGSVKIQVGSTERVFTTSGSFDFFATCTVSGSFNLTRNTACDADFDNVSVTEVIGDRSYKSGGLIPYGTLTKSELASGTSLMGYSGWSASNYAREPYSADLDFGTGEWTMSAWLKTAIAPRRNLVTYSEFPNGITDANTRVNASAVSGIDFGFATTTGIAIPTAGVDAYAYKTLTVAASTTYTVSAYIKMDDGNAPAFSATPAANDFAFVVGTAAMSMTAATVTAVGSGAYRVSASLTLGASPGTSAGVIKYATNSSRTFKFTGLQVELGSTVSAYQKVIDGTEIWSAIAERAHSSGPSISFRMAGFGTIQAVVSDGTTTRTVTSSATYANNLWLKARVSYTTDGSLTLVVNGREVARTTGTPLLTLNNSNATLTIGNSRALDAPFPGSLALLKMSASVPTSEQAQFMYEQEKQMFRAGAQSVLPDTTAVVDMAYDDATDRWVAVSASNESYWTGLVRNSVAAVPAGAFSRIAAGSGIELVARATTNPGVDVSIPAYGLREELIRRAEAAARLSRDLVVYDYTGGFTANTTNGSTAITNVAGISYPASYIGARISGTGIPANATVVAVSGTTIYISAAATATGTGVNIAFLDFDLPVGMETRAVLVAGALKQEGSTKDYTRLFDGFTEIIRFGTAPGATAWVQIQAVRAPQ